MEVGEGNNPKEIPKPLVIKAPNTRHKILRTMGAGLLGVTMLGGADQVKATSPAVRVPPIGIEQSENIDEEITRPIIDFIELHGDRELTTEDVRLIVPALARLYSSEGSRLSDEEIAASTYITRDDDNPHPSELDPSQPELNPYFIHLKEDYPQATIDPQTMFYPFLYQILGFESQEQVVLFLGNINKRDYNYKFQFDSIEQTECDKSTPAVVIINTAMHEFGHQDVEGDWSSPIPLPLDGDLMSHYEQRIRDMVDKSEQNNESPKKVSSGAKRGFAIFIKFDSPTPSEWLTGLDEWTTQYLAVKMMVNNGLPGLSVYGAGPKNIANFQAILEQSGISDQDLKELRRSSSIEEFLIRIADGAEGANFQSDSERVAFSFDLFNRLMDPYNISVWEEPFKPYFPDIDIDFYKNNPPIKATPLSCVVDNSK